jgi:hypothetical protein
VGADCPLYLRRTVRLVWRAPVQRSTVSIAVLPG